jgi:3-dehydroquinate synthase
MGGFCAATYKRGIDFILIPTTLLSQVDASIGGKLGIDFHNFKNHIGAFQIPALTIIYSGFLTTLPFHETRSGFAEIIKHALISDPPMWNLIRSRSLAEQPWDALIRHSVDFKLKVVQEDPREKGLRKILNAGHTIGHAIETHLLTNGRKIMHGEAVAAGLITEAYLASERGMLPAERLNQIVAYILRIFGKVEIRPADDERIAALTVQDKKNKENRILCVLLEDVGRARFDCEITSEEVKQALQFYRSVQM